MKHIPKQTYSQVSRALLIVAMFFSFALGTTMAQLGSSSLFTYTTPTYNGLIVGSYSGTLDQQLVSSINGDGTWLISDPTFTYNTWFTPVMGVGLKKGAKNKVVSAAEVAKQKGMTKFKPFTGSDNTRIEMDNLALTGKADEGKTLAVCTDAKNCGTAGDWMIKAGDPDKGQGYTICQSGSKNTCLCYLPEDGVKFRTKAPASTDVCSQWVLVPSKVGKDGEIKGYNIRPMSHPDHILAVDTRSNEVRVEKWSPGRSDSAAAEPGKALKTDWTFAPRKGNQNPNQAKKPTEAAEKK